MSDLPSDLKIELPPMVDQEIFVARMKVLEKIKQTVNLLDKIESSSGKIPPSWREFDNGFESPSGDEIRETFKPYTGGQIANMLGLSDSRSVRRWIGGDVQIPYAAWRLYLILTGRVLG